MNFPEHSNESNIKNLIRLKASESIVGVFRGEIYTFKSHWEGQRSTNCTGSDCAMCAKGNKAGFNFQLNFITKENGVLVPKIFQQRYKTMILLKEFNKEFPLEKNWVKITRSGNGTDTTYSIMPFGKNCELTKGAETEVSKVPLFVLDPIAKVGIEEAVTAHDGPDFSDADESIPF